jgi:hypothetical protein
MENLALISFDRCSAKNCDTNLRRPVSGKRVNWPSRQRHNFAVVDDSIVLGMFWRDVARRGITDFSGNVIDPYFPHPTIFT